MAKQQHIADLKHTLKAGTLLARVIRAWDVIYKFNDQPTSFDMLLLDKQGGLIQATIRKDLMKSFREEIVEGKLHTFNNFEVAKNNKLHCPIKNDMLIRFTPFTVVLQEEENAAEIPMHSFQIHPLDRLQERNKKTDYAIDVVGLLTGVEEKTWVNVGQQKTPLRRIHIEDQCNFKVVVTLWGAKADLISTQITQDQDAFKVLLITSTEVATYQGNYQLNSTNATKIHINLPIPEIESFKQQINRENPKTPIKHLEAKQHESLEEIMFKNRKKIEDILQMDPEAKELFTCSATITTIHIDKAWHYTSCDTCKKKIDETFYCTNCEVVVKYPKTRYLLTIDIDDGSACIPMAIFDKEAERIVGSPIHKLMELEKKDNGKQKVLQRLEHCVGKKFVFKVKLSPTSNSKELICQKSFDIDYKLEKSYQERQQQEQEGKIPKPSQFLDDETRNNQLQSPSKKRNRDDMENEKQEGSPTTKALAISEQ